MVTNALTPNRMTNNIGMLANAAVGETEDSMIWSQRSEEDSTEPYDGIRISSVRNEIFTTLDVICPRKKGMRKINSRSILELRETRSPLGHTSRCTRHSPQRHP